MALFDERKKRFKSLNDTTEVVRLMKGEAEILNRYSEFFEELLSDK